jgi:hypothetical protein
MKKGRVFALLGATFLMMALTFNNCGKVEFHNLPDVDKTAASSVDPDSSNLTDGQIQQIVAQIPPDELATIHPITDLQDPANDYLYDLYACDGGVLICHFPATVVGATQCIGRPAVASHYDHIRTYDGDKQIGDYLGNCRVAL